MMDFTSTQAQVKGVAPTASLDEGYTEVDATKSPKASPSPTPDGVDKMYHQLAEIHATHCPTSNVTHVSTGWRGPVVEPFVTRMTKLPLINFSLHSKAHTSNPRLITSPPGGRANRALRAEPAPR
jgi:hypothetical protein